MLDVAGYSPVEWLVSLFLMAIPAAAAALLLVGFEWLLRTLLQSPSTKAKYHRGNLWFWDHGEILFVLAYVVVIGAFYVIYVRDVCSQDGAAEFCF